MKYKYISFCICSCLFTVISAWAIEDGAYNRSGRGFRSYWNKAGNGAKLNGFDFYAKADLGYGYDDNVYLLPQDELSDEFFNIKSYIDLERQFNPDNKFYVSYETDLYRYNDLTREDSDNHEIIAGFDFTRMDLYGKLRDDYIDTSNINGILFVNRIKRTIHEPSLLLGYDFSKFSIEGQIIDEMRRYDSSLYDFNDHDKKTFIGSAIYHVFPNKDLYVRYDHTDIDYKTSGMRDGRYDQYGIGIKGDITPKLNGYLLGGYQHREYDSHSKSFDNAIFDISVEYKMLKNLSLKMGYLLTANESIILGDTFYEIDRITLDLNVNTLLGLKFVAGGFYEKDDFPVSQSLVKRDDNVAKIYFGAAYEFRQRYAVQMEWNRLQRDSNLDNQDYDDNMFLTSFVIKL